MLSADIKRTRQFVAFWVTAIIFGSLLIASVAAPERAFAATFASDNFARADGSLGPDWTDISDGGLAISSQTAAGTATSGVSGDTWAADSFTSDQYSEIQLTGTQPTGGQWIGTAVRSQAGGQSLYVGIYFANYGSPDAHAVPAPKRELDPARLHLRQRNPPRRHHPRPHRGRQHPDPDRKRRPAHHRHRHHPHRRHPRHHRLRHHLRRQLGRRQRRRAGSQHPLDRRHRLRAGRDPGPAGQRRRQPGPDQQRPVHLRYGAHRRLVLQRDRRDRPRRPTLLGDWRRRHGPRANVTSVSVTCTAASSGTSALR